MRSSSPVDRNRWPWVCGAEWGYLAEDADFVVPGRVERPVEQFEIRAVTAEKPGELGNGETVVAFDDHESNPLEPGGAVLEQLALGPFDVTFEEIDRAVDTGRFENGIEPTHGDRLASGGFAGAGDAETVFPGVGDEVGVPFPATDATLEHMDPVGELGDVAA
jgi:hypothetical protein